MPCIGKTRSSEGLIRFPNLAPTSFSVLVRTSSLQHVPWVRASSALCSSGLPAGPIGRGTSVSSGFAGRIGALHARVIPPLSTSYNL